MISRKNFYQTSFYIVLACAMFCSVPAFSASLDADFSALATYEFGQSRAPLQRIGEAVRAAAARHPDARYSTSDLEHRLVSALAGEGTVEGKRYACRLLGVIGADASVAALSRALDNADLFDTALMALSTVPGDIATATLVSQLQKSEPQQAPAIIAALGSRGAASLAAPLLQYLSSEDIETATAAAQALAHLASPDACLMLVGAVGQLAAPEQRLPFADACLRCAALFAETGHETNAMTVVDNLRDKAYPTHIRIAALTLQMNLAPEKARALLFEALDDPDPRMVMDALALTRRFQDPQVTAALTALLEAASPERKVAILNILAERGDVSALPAALRLTDHEDADLRIAALQAAGTLGNADLTGFLLERATSGRMAEQRVAREVLARLTDPETSQRLLSVAEGDSDESLRTRAISLLAERRAMETAPALMALAAEGASAVRAEAVRALRTLAAPEMLPALIALVGAPEPTAISEPLPQTIAQAATRLPGTDDRAAAVVAALGNADSAEARIILLDTLGLIGGDSAFTAVCSALDMPDIETRRAAVSALARFQKPEALDVLRRLATQESDDTLRSRAYTAWLALIRNAPSLSLNALMPHLEAALANAHSPADKRDFLATASLLPSPAALRMIESLLDDEAVAAEALRAAAQVSVALTGAWPEAARARLEATAAQTHTPELAEQARQALAFMDRFEGHLMAWEVAGPYFEAHVFADSLFDHVFPPETGDENVNWRILPLLADANPPYALELDRVIGGDDRVAFLRTRVHASEAQDAILELGTNDGCRVWWNGELIHSLNEGRPLTPGQDTLPVTLNAGPNDLMIAVFQHGAAWSATARLVDEAGTPLSEITGRLDQ